MARLLEHKAKEILSAHGIAVPRGRLAGSAEEALAASHELGAPPVLKAQVFSTGRASQGLVRFPTGDDETARSMKELLGRQIHGFPVTHVLVEERIQVAKELFAACIVSDELASPLALLASRGGTGVEELAKDPSVIFVRRAFSATKGLRSFEARTMAREAGLSGKEFTAVADFLVKLARGFLQEEARTLEVNPLAIAANGEAVALDCHFSVDDYAVPRHPELEIEIPREIGHPPTELERIAAKVEAADHRGTFFFLELSSEGERPVGFHGAGGGGSMMSMDALNRAGFTAKNFCDTSGNPSAAKVYRAAKHILAQRGLIGYFASGSGVASQEQFHSARGFVKAFREWPLTVPAVIRLGGNKEDVAIEVLTKFLADLPVPVEAYGKDDSAEFCAQRLKSLVRELPLVAPYECTPTSRTDAPKEEYAFQILTGRISIDHAVCKGCETRPCIPACAPKILEDRQGKAILREPADESAHRCTECLACELACFEIGKRAIEIELPIEGFEEYLARRKEHGQ